MVTKPTGRRGCARNSRISTSMRSKSPGFTGFNQRGQLGRRGTRFKHDMSKLRLRNVDRVEPGMILLRRFAQLHGGDIDAIAGTREPGSGERNSAGPIGLFWDADLEERRAIQGGESLDESRLAVGCLPSNHDNVVRTIDRRARDGPSWKQAAHDPAYGRSRRERVEFADIAVDVDIAIAPHSWSGQIVRDAVLVAKEGPKQLSCRRVGIECGSDLGRNQH